MNDIYQGISNRKIILYNLAFIGNDL